jgi:hypothetical protein
MAAAIMRNASISSRRKKEHLILECIPAQGPAVAEDNWLPGAPIDVIEVDVA